MAEGHRPRQRVVFTDDGPLLVSGPVEVELPDGTRVRSERPVVALCVCGRSRRRPFCDTSHRRRERTAERGSTPGTGGASDGAGSTDSEEDRDRHDDTATR